MTKLEKILDGYVLSGGAEKYEKFGFLDDSTIFYQAAGLFGEGLFELDKLLDFSNIKNVKEIYLTLFPSEFIAFTHEIPLIHESLLDFYSYLFNKNYITKAVYAEMLVFFQQNKLTFFERMSDEKYWSDDKKESLDEIDELMGDDVMMAELFNEALQELLHESSIHSKKAKVLQFPGNPKKAISIKDMPAAFQLRVDLKDCKPPIWRRVLIPADLTYADLHLIIQDLFEWDDDHLYAFRTPEASIERLVDEVDETDFFSFIMISTPSKDASKAEIVHDLLNFKKIDYTYDFGDDWQHVIKIEKVLSPDELAEIADPAALPIAIKGKGDAPVDDGAWDEAPVPFDLKKINDRLTKLR